jgi:RNA polymerase sigma-70 factor (ECF subfamily)
VCYAEGMPPRPPDASAALESLWEKARARWPDLDVTQAAFAKHVGGRAAGAEDMARLHAEDLLLACACAAGNARAISAFESLFHDDLRRAHGKTRATKIAFDDFAQALRQKLFVAPSAKIAEYQGTGSLRGWVRTVATRELLDMLRPAHLAERPEGDGQAFARIPAPGDAPDLQYIKRLYGAAVTAALQDAAKELEPEERNVLREMYARGLTIDQIAALRGIHRATAARRVQRARELLLSRVRALLEERLGVNEDSLRSVLRLVETELHVTLERVLA